MHEKSECPSRWAAARGLPTPDTVERAARGPHVLPVGPCDSGTFFLGVPDPVFFLGVPVDGSVYTQEKCSRVAATAFRPSLTAIPAVPVQRTLRTKLL